MKFSAKVLLEKHGWETGQGLGKKRQGMKEAVRVKMKLNKTGLGYSMGEQFTYNWWDHAYNQAAKKLTVLTTPDGSIKLEDGEVDKDLSVRKKIKKKKASEKSKYSSFTQAATLADEVTVFNEDISGKEASESENDGEDDHGTISKLSSEELFEACGRMTAHKAARHGLTLKGKLSRVEAQEKSFLEDRRKKRNVYEDKEASVNEKIKVKKNKKLNLLDEAAEAEVEKVGKLKKTKSCKKREKKKEYCERSDDQLLNREKSKHEKRDKKKHKIKFNE